MKYIKIILIVIFTLIILSNKEILANDIANSLSKKDYTDEFQEWLDLSEEEKQKVMMPRMYDFKNSKIEYNNPIYLTRMLGANISSRFSLKDIIPANLSIRNQQQTNSCWAFAAISSLETNLALSNYNNGINTSKIYDFSERHMEYTTSKTFANNILNPIGYNREVGDGGNWWTAESYFLSGIGAIPESEMPFENNENAIDISEIQNKTVSSQVYDIVYFENYGKAVNEEKTQIMNQIKQHIKNYGSVFASIHGNSSDTSIFTCYNNDTGAKYCNNSILHAPDHAVSIIGWDDNYSVDNFPENAKPSSNGAWIVRNSWGERQEIDLLELKQKIYDSYTEQCNSLGWTNPSLIPNDFIEKAGYKIEGDIAYILMGDNGLIYVSYEDKNIPSNLYGIIKSTDTVDYDNIYQYNEYFPANWISYSTSEIMLGNIFERNSSKTEYLTQVSLHVVGTYTCRVYVNPNNSSFEKKDLKLIDLKAGESETVSTGYHTLEFLKPIELTGNKFAVVIEITSLDSNTSIVLESKVNGVKAFDVVNVETGKCFIAGGHDLTNCLWEDLGKITEINSLLTNGDSTIKAFTTNELIDESLKSIEITTPPSKTSYYEGEDFDKTGMVVTAYYNSKTKPFIILDSSDYNIINGTNLVEGQNSVTITYKDKSVNQMISVEKNSVKELKITTPPTKTEYKEGQNFDKTGMIIEATRKNGSKEIITDYIIEDGNNLKNDQKTITISYEGKKVKQEIMVIPNKLLEIKVYKAPNKIDYIVGQDFDKTGMIIVGIYQDQSSIEILDYTIENGSNLTKEQTSVTISYLGKITTQNITVVEKAITGISVNKKPTKLTYIQNKENLDLSGGSITVSYNDGSTENIDMNSEQVTVTGFDNKNIGKITLTLTYQFKTAELEVEIIEELVERAENSILENANCYVKGIKAYYFTNNSQEDYTLIEVEINNIERNFSNDKVEYYYHLSTIKDEENITEWTKIVEEQNSNDKLKFTIDSKNIANYEEISKENVLYLYIKEVAIKGGNQSIALSKALLLEPEVKVETYVDNEKKEINLGNNSNGISNDKDTTVADGILPQTGEKIIIIVSITALIVIIIGFFCFKHNKFKDI